MKNIFVQNVDLRSKLSMQNFLLEHFRYEGAFAIRVKHLPIPKHLEDAFCQAQQYERYWDSLWEPVRDFEERYQHRLTICTAGRSAGYLVLHRARREETGHKSYCRTCGQRNFQSVSYRPKPSMPDSEAARRIASALLAAPATPIPPQNQCGRCGAVGERGRVNFPCPPMATRILQGVRLDAWEVKQLSMEELRHCCKDLQDFAACADEMYAKLLENLEEGYYEDWLEEAA